MRQIKGIGQWMAAPAGCLIQPSPLMRALRGVRICGRVGTSARSLVRDECALRRCFREAIAAAIANRVFRTHPGAKSLDGPWPARPRHIGRNPQGAGA
jgi:hypothetical protein